MLIHTYRKYVEDKQPCLDSAGGSPHGVSMLKMAASSEPIFLSNHSARASPILTIFVLRPLNSPFKLGSASALPRFLLAGIPLAHCHLYQTPPAASIKLFTLGAFDLLLLKYGVDRRCNHAASGSQKFYYARSSLSDKELAKLQARVVLASEKQMV